MAASSPPPGLSEASLGLPLDGSGKQLRMFPFTASIQQGDGTFVETTVYQQVLVVGDAEGNLTAVTPAGELQVADDGVKRALGEVLDELTKIRELLEEQA